MEELPKDAVAEAIVVQVKDFGVKIHRHIVLLGQSSCQCVPVRPLIYIHTCIAGILCSAKVLRAISSKVHGGLPCIASHASLCHRAVWSGLSHLASRPSKS